MSLRNAINSTTTTIVLPYSAYTSSINNILLPAPISITTITRLSPTIITLITSF